MFSIFKKKAKTNALQDVAVMEQQESPVMENITSLLVIAMTEYLKDAEQKSRAVVPVITDIRKQYDRLQSLGMGTTQNAIRLKHHIDEADMIGNDLRKANELIGFVKAVHLSFPIIIAIIKSTFKICTIRLKLSATSTTTSSK